MGILKKIFILVLFLFPFGEIIRIDLSNSIVLKPIDIGVVLIALLWLIIKFKKKEKIKQKTILVPILLFTASACLSLIINSPSLSSNQFFSSFAYLIRWIFYAGIFFIVSDFDREFRRKISKLLIVVGSFVVGLGYIQYFFYPNLRNLYYLGWDEHMYRMFSVFLDPNFVGSFFVLFFLFLINIFFKKKNIPVGLLAFFTLGAVFLTFSRSALVMLIVSSSLFFVLINRKRWIVILLGITFLVLGVSSNYFNIENINLFRVVSSEARLESTREAIMIIRDYPVFGVGFNAYRYAKLDYGLSVDNTGTISHADAGTDNSFLFVIATTGIVGFLFYTLMWIKILKSTSALVAASIIGVFVDSLFVNSLFYTYIMFWLWVIIGLNSSDGLEFKENK